MDGIQDFMGTARDVGGEDGSETGAAAGTLQGGDGLPRSLPYWRIVQVRIEVLIFLDEDEERATGRLLNQGAHLLGCDAGGGLQDGAEGRQNLRRTGSSRANAFRPIAGAWERPQHGLGNLDVDQLRVLILVNVENDGAGQRVQQVAGGDMPVRLKKHLERKGHVQQADTAVPIEGIDAGSLRRALLEQRPGRRMLDAAASVVTDLRDGVLERSGAQREEIARDDLILEARRRPIGEPIAYDFAQAPFAGIDIVPEQLEDSGIDRLHRSNQSSRLSRARKRRAAAEYPAGARHACGPRS